jgi:hypothetical protein
VSDTTRTPSIAWQEMSRGNRRFVNGEPRHPRQDVERREFRTLAAAIATQFAANGGVK